MMNRPASRLAPHLLPCLLILLAAVGWSLWRGQDVNWDLQNYHQYDPFALLHGRYGRDVAPGGAQSFLNPLPYLLPYGLHRVLPPLAAGLLVSASQAVCLMLAWFIARNICLRPVPALAATLAASTGPVVLGELGSSFCDLLLAIPALASILLVLHVPASPWRSTRIVLLLAGACTGIAIGLKPTGLFLLPALAACAALRHRRIPEAARSAGLIVIGAALGGLFSDGAWVLFLWRGYGSPLFPFMNTVFRSPSAALVDFSDPRFHFTGWPHALKIPFALASGSAATGELPIRDGRLALAACLAPAWLLTRLFLVRDRDADPLDGLCAYVLLGMAGWLLSCPIQRYAVVLEITSALLSILLLARLPGRRPPIVATLLATGLLAVTTRPCDYFHRPWRSAYQPRVPAAIPSGATYGLLALPLSYWVAASPTPAHAFSLTPTLMQTGGRLQRRLDRILRLSRDRLWLLNMDQPVDGQIRAEMSIHRIALAPPCLRAASMISIDTVFCRGVTVAGSRALAASDLRAGQTVSFSRNGYGLIYEIFGFDPTEADGTWAIGRDAMLAMHLDDATRAAGSVLSLRLAGVPGAPMHAVAITVADAGPRTLSLASSGMIVALCIGPRSGGDPTVTVRFTTSDSRPLLQLGLSPEPRRLAFRLHDMSLRPVRPGECGKR